MAKPNHHSLRGIHEGRPIAVLGGAPSLPADFERVPADAVLISVNHHAAMYTEPRGITCDYLAFTDVANPNMEGWAGLRLSIVEHQSDVDLRAFADPSQSGIAATLLACWMGGSPVVLCGFDCYSSEKYYWHEWKGPPPNAAKAPLDYRVNLWNWCFKHCIEPSRIRVMSGPLIELFGAYVDAADKAPAPVPAGGGVAGPSGAIDHG